MLVETVVVYMTKKALRSLVSKGEIRTEFDVEEAIQDIGEDLAVSLAISQGEKVLKAVVGEEAYRDALEEGKFVLAITAMGAAYIAAFPVIALVALFTPSDDADPEPFEYDPTDRFIIW